MKASFLFAATAVPAFLLAGCGDQAEPGEGAVAVNGTVITEAEADALEERMDQVEARVERLEQVADIQGGPIADAVTDRAAERADELEERSDVIEQATDAAEQELPQ